MIQNKHTILEERVNDLINIYKPYAQTGQCASYIPALRNANLFDLGICITSADGTLSKSGEWETLFTLQSISKVLSFTVVCETVGLSKVLELVDLEPTGDAFDSIIRLESNHPGKPFNPMINAGAITVASMLPGSTADEKLEPLLGFVEKTLGRRLTIDEDVFYSEWSTAHRNRAICHYLKGTGYLQSDVDVALETYLKQCSFQVNTEDLAVIGLMLSCDGYHPFQQQQIISKETARIAKSLMMTCGMYNNSGKFAAFAGVPAKSGVSGGIMVSLPAKYPNEKNPFSHGCGIGIYGPSIDKHGNSVAGSALLTHLSKEWDLSIF